MKREAPAAGRNRQPILDVLMPQLPDKGLVLEVASGTGQHVVHFAAALPHLRFQPSDPGEAQRASIDAGIGNHHHAAGAPDEAHTGDDAAARYALVQVGVVVSQARQAGQL